MVKDQGGRMARWPTRVHSKPASGAVIRAEHRYRSTSNGQAENGRVVLLTSQGLDGLERADLSPLEGEMLWPLCIRPCLAKMQKMKTNFSHLRSVCS